MTEDYYERLGVDRDASASEIKRAFRERIKETHPDVSDDEAASDRTKRLIEAKDVLTSSTERKRYDRLGHEAYVSGDPSTEDRTASGDTDDNSTPSQRSGAASEAGGGSRSESSGSTTRGQRARSRGEAETEDGTDTSRTATRETTGGDPGRSADWYDTGRREQRTQSVDGEYRVWDSDRSYAVGDSSGMFSPRELLGSQRTIVLLGTTFVIYPVLLFGALFRGFPPAVNLTVAMCIVLVIAFMQSVPQVGVLVFGTWTVLLPIVLFGIVGTPVLSLRGVFSMTAVLFPLGLSLLTWIAIRPSNR